MKADHATHAVHGHATQRTPGARGRAADPAAGDPFAQLLADLRAQDEAALNGTGADSGSLPGANQATSEASSGLVDAELVPDAETLSGERKHKKDDAELSDAVATGQADTSGMAAAVAVTGQTTTMAAGEAVAAAGMQPRDVKGTDKSLPGADAPKAVADPNSALAAPSPTGLPGTPVSPLEGNTSTATPTTRPSNPVAELAAAGGLGRNAPAGAPQPGGDSPFGQWVSTLARSKVRPGGVGRGSSAEGPADSSRPADPVASNADHRARAERMGLADTVILPPAAAMAAVMATSTDNRSTDPRQDSLRGSDAAGSTQGPGHGTDAGNAASATGPLPEAADFGQQLGQALGETFEAIGTQISLWAAGKTQRASFSVDEGLDDPLSIDLTVTNGVAELAFRTDDGAMRDLLQAQTPAALSDALARAGLTLGGFSVGGQAAQDRGGSPEPGGRATRVRLVAAADGDGAASLTQGVVRSSAPRGGLDVYA